MNIFFLSAVPWSSGLFFVFFLLFQGVIFFLRPFASQLFLSRLVSVICLQRVRAHLLYIQIQIRSQILHSLHRHGNRHLPPQTEARPRCSSHRRSCSSQIRISRLRTGVDPPLTTPARHPGQSEVDKEPCCVGVIICGMVRDTLHGLLDHRRARFAQRLLARLQGGQSPEVILERESTLIALLRGAVGAGSAGSAESRSGTRAGGLEEGSWWRRKRRPSGRPRSGTGRTRS